MYSAVLRRSAFSRLVRQLPDKTKTAAALRKSLRAVAKYLADAGKALAMPMKPPIPKRTRR